jgi:hypothetical protein
MAKPNLAVRKRRELGDWVAIGDSDSDAFSDLPERRTSGA